MSNSARSSARPGARAAVWLLALFGTFVATSSWSAGFERAACHDLDAKARIRGLGAGWVLLGHELVRGAAPDYRVQVHRWTMLDHEGATHTWDLPATTLLAALPPALLGTDAERRNTAGHRFDAYSISPSYSAHAVVGDRGDELGLIVNVSAPKGSKVGRKLAVVWQIRAGKVVAASTPLVEAGGEGRHGFVAGQDAKGRWLFVAAEALRDAAGTSIRYTVQRIDDKTGALTTVATSGPVVRTGDHVNAASRCVFGPDRGTLACVEYQEDPEHPAGVHLMDLTTGKATVLAAPATCYVLAFAPDGARLALGGNRTSEVWIYDTATGKRVATGKGPAKMHQGTWLADGRLLLLGEGLPTLFDPTTLKALGTVALKDAFGPRASGGLLPREVDWLDTAKVGIPLVRSASTSGFGEPAQVCWLRPTAPAAKAPPPR